MLHTAGEPLKYVYFPEDGALSIVAIALDGKQVEVDLFGREAMSNFGLFSARQAQRFAAYVQVESAAALRLPIRVFDEALRASETLRARLSQFAM